MSLSKIRKNSFVFLLTVFLAFCANGCIYLVVGGVGAVGGYVVSPDTVEGVITEREKGEIWDAAIEVATVMGVVQEQNQLGGSIFADMQGTKVTINVMRSTQNQIKLSVKARRTFFPKIKIAQDVYTKIVNYLDQ